MKTFSMIREIKEEMLIKYYDQTTKGDQNDLNKIREEMEEKNKGTGRMKAM